MAIQTIGTDVQAVTTANTSTNQASGTSNFMNYLAMGTSVAGPVVEQSLLASGNTSGAAIAAATGNSVYGASMTAAGGTSYLSTGSLGSSYSGAAYYGGSGSYSTTGTTDVESILTDSAASNAYLIGIQAQIQQQGLVYGAITNVMKSKSDMDRSITSNLK